ncbi:MAG: hypothetical protein WCR85_00170 [Sphaerochaeta sp.]
MGKIVIWDERYEGTPAALANMDIKYAEMFSDYSGMMGVDMAEVRAVTQTGEMVFYNVIDGQIMPLPASVEGGNIETFRANLVLMKDGSVKYIDDYGGEVPAIPEGIVAVDICSNGQVCFAVSAAKDVIAWGSLGDARWENIPADLKVDEIAVSGDCAIARQPDGTLIGWGNDADGLVAGIPEGILALSISMSSGHALVAKTDGTVVAWGESEAGQCQVPMDLTGVTKVAAGEGVSFALKDDGSIAAWGGYISPEPM